ncbi:MAG: Fe-S protein assembly co-chaperone HscB [Candidatus Accumulibacter sp.]|jgi:molecular chaperone HscB|nr:Fe-S protein assembly co-chaperone HscB [Accumulibacter sp.]
MRPGKDGDAASALDEIDFGADHFTLFGLAPFFRVDLPALDKRFRELLARVHPDRFTQAGASERRASLQWATRINEAYQTLKIPLSRARYLLDRAGRGVDQDNNTVMPPEFLMEQMEWREAVAEARAAREAAELEQLHYRVKQRMNKGYDQLAELLDDRRDYAAAAERVRRLMFLEKLLFEIDDAMAALET